MKITFDHNIIEFTPESPEETSSLDALWKKVVDCGGNPKKIVPMGNFIPGIDKLARFHMEGGATSEVTTENLAPEDASYYCSTCNKYTTVKAGDPLPHCCGRVMEAM